MSYALLFPGQGAQAVGMGKELAEAFPQSKKIFEQADALLESSLSRLCWEGPAEELTRTEWCQPALYVTSLAALAALEAQGAKPLAPKAAAGLSLGEYTALAAAGVFSFEDGLRLVHLRGQAMEEAARAQAGTMASVLGLELPDLESLCVGTGAQVANINSPGQLVISGPTQAVQAVAERAKAKGAKRVIPLEVGGAFHSQLMAPAGDRLKAAAASVVIRAPRFPVASNVTGAFHEGPDLVCQRLVEQLTRPVQWIACMQTLIQSGITLFIEMGSGSVLKGLAKKIDPGAQVLSAGTADQIRDVARQLS